MRRYFTLLVVGCLALVGCGGDDKTTETTPKATPSAAAAVDLAPIKDYLLEHTDRLVTSTELLQRDAQEYYNLAEAADFDYAKLLRENRPAVPTAVKKLQDAHIQANPAYEEMEGVVAGVPSLADYDVIIDAGADGSDPENAVPFSLKTKSGKEFKQPGNFFALVETSVFGTEPKFTAPRRQARPRRRRQGHLPRGAARRGLPPGRDDRLRQVRQGARHVGQAVGPRRSRTPTPPWS